jgi:hypothetical protein
MRRHSAQLACTVSPRAKATTPVRLVRGRRALAAGSVARLLLRPHVHAGRAVLVLGRGRASVRVAVVVHLTAGRPRIATLSPRAVHPRMP